MRDTKKSVLLVAMPFAGITIPSIQLPVLATYCQNRSISIQTRHLYLKAAEIYGLQNYHNLIYPPNDSYTAQMVFSRYVFPDHWRKNQHNFQKYFEAHTAQHSQSEPFTFQDYVDKTDVLYHWIVENVPWRSVDLIGFTLNYGQFLPSLAIAKHIKELAPEKKIIFGGSRTTGDLGVNILKAFPYIDYIVSGDGEDALFQLASGEENPQTIPQLIYKNKNEVLWNKSEKVLDLNTLPVPCYDKFYQDLSSVASDIQYYFQYHGRLPLEISRGCWWNACTFCNLNIQHQCYREKSIGRILQELQFLSERYRMMDFQLIGNTLPKTNYRILFEKIKKTGKDFSFFVEARAEQLTSQDYMLMKEAGFTTIQTGIESFSRNYLKKMNKGVRVIDNIAALKFCKENQIKNIYNLLVRYPNEEQLDFEETQNTVQLLKTFLDAPRLCELRLMQGSIIYRHPEHFNIDHLKYTSVDKIMYPVDYLEKGISFVYDFTPRISPPYLPWETLVEEWKKEQQTAQLQAISEQNRMDHFVFYYIDGGSFMKIYDKRDRQNIKIHVLNELERTVFLSCIDIISFKELQRQFLDVPEFELAAILQSFEKNGIVYEEDDYYLSLPLRCCLTNTQDKKEECLVNISP